MAILHVAFTLSFVLLVFALQVTPDSPCAAVCLDDRTQEVSDPKLSNTFGNDIVCRDSKYPNTIVGEKFKSCIGCLQGSTFAKSGETDQAWFLYNMRYAFDTCLYGFVEASDPISTPCSTDSSCGHLQKALEIGDLDPTASTYGYCSADNNAFLGSFLPKCLECLQNGGDTQYLTNFLTALQAGCLQHPEEGWLIGIQGSVFSSSTVNITFPGYNQESTNSKKKGLAQPAIIGIAVGGAILLAIVTAVIYVYCRKRRERTRRLQISSPLDSRYGAKNISSPTDGAYGNPYTDSPSKVTEPFHLSTLSSKERQVLGLDRPAIPNNPSITKPQAYSSPVSPDADYTRDAGYHLPPYSACRGPTHQAYIPEFDAGSRVTSIDSSNTFQMSPYSSPQASPTRSAPPPPVHVSTGDRTFLPVRTQASSMLAVTPPYLQGEARSPSRSILSSESGRITAQVGVGNANASTISPIDGDTKNNYGRRIDVAETERRERDLIEQKSRWRRRKTDVTPESTQEDEQWPGIY